MTSSTVRHGNTLIFGFWLVFHANGEMKLHRREPAARAASRVMFVEAAVPLAVFKTPTMRATITLPEAAAHNVLTGEVVLAAEEALRAVVGCDVVLTVKDAES